MMMMMILHMFLKSSLITKIPVRAGVCWILAVKASLQTAGADRSLLMCVFLEDYCVESHQPRGEEQDLHYV